MEIAEKIQRCLSPLLGTNTARIAVRTFATKLGKSPETLDREDLPALAMAMHAMLKTLCGTANADSAVKTITEL